MELAKEPTVLAARYRGLVAFLLMVIFVANQATRALPCYLVTFTSNALPESAMNVALHFGSARYGALATMTFTLPFTLASLGAGLLADRANRLLLISLAGLVWSACTLCMAITMSYQGLVLERALLGASQAAMNPAALSLIADLFPESRATMSSVFNLGIYIGGGVASLGGALDQKIGWRSTCAIYGLGSALVSSLVLTCRDPRPEQTPQQTFRRRRVVSVLHQATAAVPSFTLEMLTRTKEALALRQARLLLLAATLRFCAGFAIMVWLPSAIHWQFPESMGRFALLNSLIKAVAGSISSLLGGITADFLRARGYGDAAGSMFCAVSSAAAVPLFWLVLQPGSSFETSMVFLCLEYLVAESWLGPAVTTLHAAVPAERRGTAQGVFSSLTAMGNALPMALGLLGDDRLVQGLQASVSACYLGSALCFAAASYGNEVPSNPQDHEMQVVQSSSESSDCSDYLNGL